MYGKSVGVKNTKNTIALIFTNIPVVLPTIKLLLVQMSTEANNILVLILQKYFASQAL